MRACLCLFVCGCVCMSVCACLCVLCVPSLFQRKEHLQRTATALAEATHIVIAGGGPTGVEVAGEILHQFGRKNITIVHPRGRLLEQCPDRTSHKAMARLVDEFNVDVILNDALLIPADEFQVRCRFARVEDGLGHDTTVSMYANVCLCVCVRVCACACACMCVCVCVWAHVTPPG